MKKFEYYCCWINVYNATSLQEFLDKQGLNGWELHSIILGKEPDVYQSLVILKKEIV